MGRVPSRLGYQPTLATELARLEERICQHLDGAITSIQAVYVPADDFTDPAAVHVFGTCPRRSCCPANEPARACTRPSTRCGRTRRCSSPQVVGHRHYRIARSRPAHSRCTSSSRTSSPCSGARSSRRRISATVATRPPARAVSHAAVLRHGAVHRVRGAARAPRGGAARAASASSTTSSRRRHAEPKDSATGGGPEVVEQPDKQKAPEGDRAETTHES
jgi:hypothetical protein